MVEELRNLDVAQKASMDVLSLNNIIVSMRKKVKKAKGQSIQKLSRLIKQLKSKKGSEEQILQNNKKADRLHQEISTIKSLPIDKVAKFALQNESQFKDIAKQANAAIETKSLVRLSEFKEIQQDVAKFREGRDDWRQLAAFVMTKNTGRRMKKKKSGEKKMKRPLRDLDEFGAKHIAATDHSKNVTDVKNKELDKKSKSVVNEVHEKDIQTSAVASGSESENSETDNDVDKSADEAEDIDSDSNSVDKSNDDASEQHVDEIESKVEVIPQPTNKEMIITKINLDSLGEEGTISTTKVATDEVEGSSEEESSDEEATKDQPAVKKRSSFFLSANGSSGEDDSEDEEKEEAGKDEATTGLDRRGSHWERNNYGGYGRGRGRGRGGMQGRMNPQSTQDNDQSKKPAEKLHPSWEASKKRKQQVHIQAFQGKKIKFDD